jgi:hypothetical protein
MNARRTLLRHFNSGSQVGVAHALSTAPKTKGSEDCEAKVSSE